MIVTLTSLSQLVTDEVPTSVTKVVECRLAMDKSDLSARQLATYDLLTDWMHALPRECSSSATSSDIFVAFLHLSYQ